MSPIGRPGWLCCPGVQGEPPAVGSQGGHTAHGPNLPFSALQSAQLSSRRYVDEQPASLPCSSGPRSPPAQQAHNPMHRAATPCPPCPPPRRPLAGLVSRICPIRACVQTGPRAVWVSCPASFPERDVSRLLRVSACQRVSARVRPCPRLRGPSRVPLPSVGLACVRRSRPEGLRGSTVLAPCRTMQSCVLVPEHGRVLRADPSHAATRVWECLSHLTEPKGVFEPASTGV